MALGSAGRNLEFGQTRQTGKRFVSRGEVNLAKRTQASVSDSTDYHLSRHVKNDLESAPRARRSLIARGEGVRRLALPGFVSPLKGWLVRTASYKPNGARYGTSPRGTALRNELVGEVLFGCGGATNRFAKL
jgi:hypothetical protein